MTASPPRTRRPAPYSSRSRCRLVLAGVLVLVTVVITLAMGLGPEGSGLVRGLGWVAYSALVVAYILVEDVRAGEEAEDG